MSKEAQSLQDEFLRNLCKNTSSVSIFLINGIKLQGQLEAFDNYVVMLKNATTQMVFKHAISTIVPAHSVAASGVAKGEHAAGSE